MDTLVSQEDNQFEATTKLEKTDLQCLGEGCDTKDSKCLGEDAKPLKTKFQFSIPKNKGLPGGISQVTRKKPKWEAEENKLNEVMIVSTKKQRVWGPDLTQDQAVKLGRALALQTRAEQIAAQLENGKLESCLSDFTRSPSPPPIYDSNGQRINTREGRKREQLELERREAIGECMRLNPKFKPPAGFKPLQKEATLPIPVREYPGYNFIGLILGPRGNTQKRMELATGTKIAIRGKGAIKEGKLAQGTRYNGKDTDGANDDLHVYITGDSYEKVDAAVALIKPLLTPVDESNNAHKKKQLRELAEMNGTVREPSHCSLCGESGHRDWLCPKEKVSSHGTKVTCHICGDGSHPSVDCPRTDMGKTLDTEYLSFLQELEDGMTNGNALSSSPANKGTMLQQNLDSKQVILQENNNLNPSKPMLITASGPVPVPSTWTNDVKEEHHNSSLNQVNVSNPQCFIQDKVSNQKCSVNNNLASSFQNSYTHHHNIVEHKSTVFPGTKVGCSTEGSASNGACLPIQSCNLPETVIPSSPLRSPFFPSPPLYFPPFAKPGYPNVFMPSSWTPNFNPSQNFQSTTPWIQTQCPPQFWSTVSSSTSSPTNVLATNSNVSQTMSSNSEKEVSPLYSGMQPTSGQVQWASNSPQVRSPKDPLDPNVSCMVSHSTSLPHLNQQPVVSKNISSSSMSTCEESPSISLNLGSGGPSTTVLGIVPLVAKNINCATQAPLANCSLFPWARAPFCSPCSVGTHSILNPMLSFAPRFPSSNLVGTSSNLLSFSFPQTTFHLNPSIFSSSTACETITSSSSKPIQSPVEKTLFSSRYSTQFKDDHQIFQTPSNTSVSRLPKEDTKQSAYSAAESEYERILALVGVK